MSTKAKVVIISGPPGAGKSTLAQYLADNSSGKCAHVEGDVLYNMVRSGGIHLCEVPGGTA